MPDSVIYEESGNILDQLSDYARDTIAVGIVRRWTNATHAIQDLLDNSLEGWDFYLSNKPKDMSRTDSKDASDVGAAKSRANGVRMGDIPKTIDSLAATMHSSTFPEDDRFFRGNPKNDLSRDLQEQYESFKAENFGEARFTEELWKLRLSLLIDGTAVLACPFERRRRPRITYERRLGNIPITNMLGLENLIPLSQVVEPDAIDWEGTQVQALSFTDWRADPTARNFDEAWFIRRWYMPTHQVEEQYPIENVQPYHTFIDQWEEMERYEKAGVQAWTINKDEEIGQRQALLMICYDDFVVDGEVYKNHAAVVLNDKDLIWFGPNPYAHGKKPYTLTPCNVVPGQLYGMPVILHAIPMAKYRDALFDKFARMLTWMADPIFLTVITDAGVKKMAQTNMRPGMKIPVESPTAIQQLPIQIPNITVLQEVFAATEGVIREVTGANNIMTGDEMPKGQTTAFEIDQRQMATNTRIQLLNTIFNNTCLEPLINMAFENDRQFKEKTEYVAGFKDPLTPDAIKQMEYKWTITAGSATASRAKQLSNMRSWVMEVMPGLVQAGIVTLKKDRLATVDPIDSVRKMLQYAGFTNADEIIQEQDLQTIAQEGGIGPDGLPVQAPDVLGGDPIAGAGGPPEATASVQGLPSGGIPG